MKKEKLIIIDDNVIGLIPIQKYLEQELNIDVEIFENVEDSIEYLKKDNNAFVILLDIRMPKINGLDAVKIIKENGILAPIVFFTEINPEIDFLHEAYQYGIIDYIVKPVTSEEKEILKNKLKVLLEITIYKHKLEIELENTQKMIQKIDINFMTYKSLIDSINLSYIITDLNLNILELNDSSVSICPFKKGASLYEYIYEYDKDKFKKSLNKSQASKFLGISAENINIDIRSGNNKILNIIGNIQNNGKEKYMFLIQDITSHKIQEEEERVTKEVKLKKISEGLKGALSLYEKVK